MDAGHRRSAEMSELSGTAPSPSAVPAANPGTDVNKEALLTTIFSDAQPPLAKYAHVVVGRNGLGAVLAYDLVTGCFGDMPGAAGFWFRQKFYQRLVQRCGGGVVWGRHIILRHPNRLVLGNRVAFDDDCTLDAKGAPEGTGIRLGDDVLIARGSILLCKTGPITMGDRCTVGCHAQFASVGGIVIGNSVMIAGNCYIGGGRYRTDPAIPIREQSLYSNGPTVIEDDVWVGSNVVIQDGIRIGRGSIIGGGAVIRENIPPYTVVTPHVRLIMTPRGIAGDGAPHEPRRV
jgi:acetyltransferase-like isoleucine patch superfamily enzyme